MGQSYTDGKNNVPFLGDIPLLGHLFGSTSQVSQKRELVVLIKTTLIRDSKDWRPDLESTQQRFQTYGFPESRP